jgi:hypothetical protein
MHYIAYTILVSGGFVPIWVWFGGVVNEGIEKLNFMVYFFTSANSRALIYILFIFTVSIVMFRTSRISKVLSLCFVCWFLI